LKWRSQVQAWDLRASYILRPKPVSDPTTP
jgi:hypothetical protein